MKENPIIHVSYDSSGLDDSVLVCTKSQNGNYYMVSGKIGEQADDVYRIVSTQDGLKEHDNKIKNNIIYELIEKLERISSEYKDTFSDYLCSGLNMAIKEAKHMKEV